MRPSINKKSLAELTEKEQYAELKRVLCSWYDDLHFGTEPCDCLHYPCRCNLSDDKGWWVVYNETVDIGIGVQTFPNGHDYIAPTFIEAWSILVGLYCDRWYQTSFNRLYDRVRREHELQLKDIAEADKDYKQTIAHHKLKQWCR